MSVGRPEALLIVGLVLVAAGLYQLGWGGLLLLLGVASTALGLYTMEGDPEDYMGLLDLEEGD